MNAEQKLREKEILGTVEAVAAQGPFAAEWDSLSAYQIPEWYADAKFGIFIHWGVYCVPAFGNEWYPRSMYLADKEEFNHHVATYGPQGKFGYKDFIPEFKAERFSAEAWIELFEAAGAKFVVPVAEHHDGFSMYDNSLSEWNSVEMGPKRDVVGELAEAAEKRGMIFGLSSHRAEHWWFFDGGRTFDSDVNDPAFDGLYGPAQPQSTPASAEHLDNWLARTSELVDKYKPRIVWFDWWIEEAPFEPYLRKFAAFYYNRGAEWGDGSAINYKHHAYRDGTAVFDVERGQLKGLRPLLWQTDTSVSNKSWGYIEGDDFKPAADIVQNLIDIVSKNGVLLLNVGPRADGTIPEEQQQILREVGEWLKANGEAIYGTRPWKLFGEGPTEVEDGQFSDTKRSAYTPEDIRFTRKGDTLYAFFLAPPGEKALIKSLAGVEIKSVELLTSPGPLSFMQMDEGLEVTLPSELPASAAYTLRIEATGL